MVNPFYILAVLLFGGGLFLGRNNKYAAYACFLVMVLALFVGTYHHAQ